VLVLVLRSSSADCTRGPLVEIAHVGNERRRGRDVGVHVAVSIDVDVDVVVAAVVAVAVVVTVAMIAVQSPNNLPSPTGPESESDHFDSAAQKT
jgi:hypothetical protein